MNVIFPVSSSLIFAIRKGICASGKLVFGGGSGRLGWAPLTEPSGDIVTLELVGIEELLRRTGSEGTAKPEGACADWLLATEASVAGNDTNLKGSTGKGVSKETH